MISFVFFGYRLKCDRIRVQESKGGTHFSKIHRKIHGIDGWQPIVYLIGNNRTPVSG
jgi:hypothetical protein